MTFATRRAQHDEVALKAVCDRLEQVGALTSAFGIEIDNEALRLSLRQQHDAMSLMLRYRPDRAVVMPKVQTVLCEVKSTTPGKPTRNFAIEMDSYAAARQWHNDERKVMYAFVDMDTDPIVIKGCWCGDLPSPSPVLVPQRPGYESTLQRLEQTWPALDIRSCRWSGGSGTPFFLVWKDHPNLKPFDVFCQSLVVCGNKP